MIMGVSQQSDDHRAELPPFPRLFNPASQSPRFSV
jgi:hypothetical protein